MEGLWVVPLDCEGVARAAGLADTALYADPPSLQLPHPPPPPCPVGAAPPLKLKQSGWAGNYALGSSYIALPWWAGQALFGTLTLDVMVLTVLYSIAGLGIAIVNDFKSIEGGCPGAPCGCFDGRLRQLYLMPTRCPATMRAAQGQHFAQPSLPACPPALPRPARRR